MRTRLLESIRKKTIGMTALSQNKTKEVDCTPVDCKSYKRYYKSCA